MENLDAGKSVFVEEIADEGEVERALRHYGEWLKRNKGKIVLIDRFIICGRTCKIKVLYQKIDDGEQKKINF
jgi:hypothetical protein